jgi:hypothetical protein
MNTLVHQNGSIRWGLYGNEIDHVNYDEYRLETAMGLPIPKVLRRLLVNQFHFVGIIGPEFIMGLAIVDLKYLTNGFVYLYERQTKKLHEMKKLALPNTRTCIEPSPTRGKSTFSCGDMHIKIDNGSLSVQSRDISADLALEIEKTQPLRICTRAGYRGWVYTQKTSPVAVKGTVSYAGNVLEISSPSYLALSDWTCGYMRRKTFWNWAATASTMGSGQSFGMNLSCGVNETGFTENAFWLDGTMTKVDTVDFEFDRKNLYAPWHIRSFDQKVDLSFHPESHRGENINTFLIASRFTQMIGVFDGTLKTDTGKVVHVVACPGFAEDHYAKW